MKKRISVLLSLLLALSMLMAGCSSSKTSTSGATASTGSKIINLFMIASPDGFNPYFGSGGLYTTMATADLMFNSLVTIDTQWNIITSLAETWDISKDNMTYTFHLRKNVKWHDGQPFTSADVLFTYKTIMDPAWTGTGYVYLNTVKGAADYKAGKSKDVPGLSAPDDYTVVIQLSKPYAPFLESMAKNLYVLPKHCFDGVAVKDIPSAPFSKNPVGTGAVKFVKYATDQYVEYDTNRDYFKGAPKFDKLILKIMNTDLALAAFEKGELDATSNQGLGTMPVTDYNKLASLKNVKVTAFDTTTVQFVTANTKKAFLKESKFRMALRYAIDRQAIVDQLLQGRGKVSYASIPTFSPYYSDGITKANYDPAKAKALLSEIGWDSKTQLTLLVPKGNVTREHVAPILKQYFSDVGINVNLEYTEFATLMSKCAAGDYDLAMIGTGASQIDPNAAYYNFFYSTMTRPAGYNLGFYNNPAFDKLLDEGVSVVDFNARKVVYDQIQKLESEDSPFVNLYFEQAVGVVSNRVKNITPTPVGVAWNIQDWEIVN